MLNLWKVDLKDIVGQKALFDFISLNNPGWKKSYIIILLSLGQKVPLQANLSDFEYYIMLKKIMAKIPTFLSVTDYLLLDVLTPVTHIYTIREGNVSGVDISFTTDIKYRNRGYASEALRLLEEKIFKNARIIFATITDLSRNGESGKIATKAGYAFDQDKGVYIKFNPKIKPEKLAKKAIRL